MRSHISCVATIKYCCCCYAHTFEWIMELRFNLTLSLYAHTLALAYALKHKYQRTHTYVHACTHTVAYLRKSSKMARMFINGFALIFKCKLHKDDLFSCIYYGQTLLCLCEFMFICM